MKKLKNEDIQNTFNTDLIEDMIDENCEIENEVKKRGNKK